MVHCTRASGGDEVRQDRFEGFGLGADAEGATLGALKCSTDGRQVR